MRSKSVVVFKIIFAILLITGIIERAGLLGAEPQLKTFYSFATISNLFVFIICLVSLYQIYSKKAETAVYYRLRLIGVVMILITGLVYHFVLLPEKIAVNPSYQVFTYGNLMAHYVAPCLMFIDWLLFAEKGRIGKMEPFICTMIPVAYFTITSLIGGIASKFLGLNHTYVYFFMDFDRLGVAGVIKWCLLLYSFFLLLVYSIYGVDYFFGKNVLNVKN